MANNENIPATEKMVEVYIPKIRPDEEDLFVSVNMRTFIVKKGERVKVPECVAQQIEHMQKMRYVAMTRMSSYNKQV
jgi:hypothetical protein